LRVSAEITDSYSTFSTSCSTADQSNRASRRARKVTNPSPPGTSSTQSKKSRSTTPCRPAMVNWSPESSVAGDSSAAGRPSTRWAMISAELTSSVCSRKSSSLSVNWVPSALRSRFAHSSRFNVTVGGSLLSA
jgi:hypothetical protein